MAGPQHRSRRRRRKSWLGRVLLWSIFAVVALLVAVAIATPWILRAVVPDAFARLGLEATVAGGSLSLVRREIALQGFVLGAARAPAVSLGELGLGFAVRDLIKGRIKLRHVRVTDIDIDFERLLAMRDSLDAGTGSRSRRLPIELGELDLQDIRLLSTSERMGQDVRITRLKVSDPSALIAQRPSSVSLVGSVGEGSVDLQLDVDLDPGTLEVSGSYRIEKLPLRGWVPLVSGIEDPLSAGALSARGALRSEFALESSRLRLSLEGWLSAAGLGARTQSFTAERGDVDWRGRLAFVWSADKEALEIRGDGALDVHKLELSLTAQAPERLRAGIEDVSWQGDFHLLDGLESQGAVLATGITMADNSRAVPAWQASAGDFSSRLDAAGGSGGKAIELRLHDVDLARFSITTSDDGAPLDIAAEKLVVDELRSSLAGDMALGKATLEALTIARAGGAASEGGAKVAVNGVVASGVEGQVAGTLQATRMSADSLDYASADRRLRAQKIGIAGAGFGPADALAAASLSVASARLEEGGGDIWISGIEASNVQADTAGRAGAEVIKVARAFQGTSAPLSWEASGLRLAGVKAAAESISMAGLDLAQLKLGHHDASLQCVGARMAGLTIAVTGQVDAARMEFESLQAWQPERGNVRVSRLDGQGFRAGHGRGDLKDVTVASLEYRAPDGFEIAVHAVQAQALGGDAENGLTVAQLRAGAAEGRDHIGARLTAADLESSDLVLGSGGDLAIKGLGLARFSRQVPGAESAELGGLDVAALKWIRGGDLSAARAALKTVRLVSPEDRSWALTQIETGKVIWDGGAHLNVDRLALASLSRSHAQAEEWRVHAFEAAGLALTLPDALSVETMAAASVGGGAGSLTWRVASLAAQGLRSSDSAGQSVERLSSGAVEVSDAGNGGVLSVERIMTQRVVINVVDEIAAQQLIAGGLRLASSNPERAARLSVAELRAEAPSLRVGGIVDLGELVVRNPYLVIAQSADNEWMWPPLPGSGARTAGDTARDAGGGVRIGRFTTSGPGRVVYIDRGTDPVSQLRFDPIVAAIENLDTTLPGNRSRFRLRGTTHRFGGLALKGELTKGVDGFDLTLSVDATGIYLPELNPHIARHEPIAATSGWGDARGAISLENGQLEGRIEVLLSGLRLRALSGTTKQPSITPKNLTLSAALALLRDRHGNIHFVIPLKAQTKDPGYDFVDHFQHTAVGAITGAARATASISVRTIESALELLGATVSILPGVDTTRYPPIPFAAGSDGFTARNLEYVNQLGDRMLRSDALVIALCGRAVPADAESIPAKATTIDKLFARAGEGVYPLYGTDDKAMRALGAARVEIVQRYLRELRGVQGAQLAPCSAELDAAPEDIPRVDLVVKSRPRRGLFGLFP